MVNEGYVCGYCELIWPPLDVYAACPRCLEQTMLQRRSCVLSVGDAEAMAAEAKFGWWLLNQWLTPAPA